MRPASWTANRYLRGDCLDRLPRGRERLGDSGDAQPPDQLRMAAHERFHVRRRGGLADGRGDVQRVEIAGIDEAVHGAQVDVIGVHVVGMFPAQFADGRIGGGLHAGRVRNRRCRCSRFDLFQTGITVTPGRGLPAAMTQAVSCALA